VSEVAAQDETDIANCARTRLCGARKRSARFPASSRPEPREYSVSFKPLEAAERCTSYESSVSKQ
jgi:hypothetical protein